MREFERQFGADWLRPSSLPREIFAESPSRVRLSAQGFEQLDPPFSLIIRDGFCTGREPTGDLFMSSATNAVCDWYNLDMSLGLEPIMPAAHVVDLYKELAEHGITIWVDGGWSVDALLGKQLRTHKDLDIAIEWKDVPRLRGFLLERGYKQVREDSRWNFVLADTEGHEIDIHGFIYDEQKRIVDGVLYPTGSLTGTGTIDGTTVNCIAPQYQVEFLAPWIHKWPEKYVPAMAALCERFGIELPPEYKQYVRSR